MPSFKRALLIACPFNGLRGPMCDAKAMENVLRVQGFMISTCYRENATRQGIIGAWKDLINSSSSDDTVVIYYSGHGGIVQDISMVSNNAKSHPNSWRYQFLVPMDFEEGPDLIETDTEPSFSGILDIELESLLQDLTNRTHNVTTIFDCCHSGQMARDPSNLDAVPRYWYEIKHATISRYVDSLHHQTTPRYDSHLSVEGNPHAVRIAAAASTETAWEYIENGQWAGAMTQELTRALQQAWESRDSIGPISWKAIMTRVCELVKVRFPGQTPHVEGPGDRTFFTLQEVKSNFTLLQPDGDEGLLRAGRISGVREGNLYTLMPLGTQCPIDKASVGMATVVQVDGLTARATILLSDRGAQLPIEGVLAFPVEEAPYRWPVAFPTAAPSRLREDINKSRFLRCQDSDKEDSCVAEFQLHGQTLILSNIKGVQIASHSLSNDNTETAIKVIVQAAEQLAKGQHLRSLSVPEDCDERLSHSLSVKFGTMKDSKPDRVVEQDGTGMLTVDEKAYISLMNSGNEEVWVSVFQVNVAGKVSHISSGQKSGIPLKCMEVYNLGAGKTIRPPQGRGLSLSWPRGVTQENPIDEYLVLIATDSPLDLTSLATSNVGEARGDAGLSFLAKLSLLRSTGARRDMGGEDSTTLVRFDVLHIPYRLSICPPILQPVPFPGGEGRDIQVDDIPGAEQLIGDTILPLLPPAFEKEPRGPFGAIIRATKRVPACVWVVNEHVEEISVVVSKYRPNRLVSGGGLNVSTTGAGVDLSTTSFTSPACRKVLAAYSDQEELKTDSTGVFPLWTRKEGFGVISIFRGVQRELYIENDQVPLGATVVFQNKPNLKIINYETQ